MMKINKILIVLCCFLSIISAIKILNNGDIYNILIRLSFVLVVLIPTILRKLKINISSSSEFIFIIFAFIGHFLGSILNFYNIMYWFDTFTHFLSGIVVAFFTLELIKKSKFKTNHIFEIIFILGVSSLVATSWEIYEFTCDKLFNKDAQHVLTTGVDDTMKDMIVALLGSLLFNICYIYEHINNKKLIINKFIEKL